MPALVPPRAPRHALAPALAIVVLLATGCIPYTVGATAQTVPAGERTETASVFVMPNAAELLGDTATVGMRSVDYETRFGIDDRSDVGVRIPSGSGLVVSYKRRIAGRAHPDAAALAWMAGAGLVNWAEHAHVELTFAGSLRSWHRVTPYGGLRAMQVLPISTSAVHDTPTAGGFVGVRIGTTEFGVSPEVGVFHDRSALGLRKATVIVVPAISLHGDLIEALDVATGRRRAR